MKQVNEQPKISIITVVFNGAKTLEQTILSVVNQTYVNIEYIIIDGGSTDGTLDIIKKYEDRIAYWVSDPDGGIYDAMNKGIDVATGEWICFLGADDWLAEKEIIKNISVHFNKNEKIDVLSGQVWTVNEILKLQIKYSNKFNLQDIYIGYCIPHQGLFVKSDILKKYRFDCSYKIVADYDMFLKLYFDKNIKFKYIEEKIAFYSDAGISSIEIKKRVNEDIIVMKKYGIPAKYISQYEELIKDSKGKFLKKSIKNILKKLGWVRYILKYKGWTDHQCAWNTCRCCRQKNG